jgi:hypothetical protein
MAVHHAIYALPEKRAPDSQHALAQELPAQSAIDEDRSGTRSVSAVDQLPAALTTELGTPLALTSQ